MNKIIWLTGLVMFLIVAPLQAQPVTESDKKVDALIKVVSSLEKKIDSLEKKLDTVLLNQEGLFDDMKKVMIRVRRS